MNECVRLAGMDSPMSSYVNNMLQQGPSNITRNLNESFNYATQSIARNVQPPETSPETPRTSKTSKKYSRGPCFTAAEDKLIISAWLNISQDPILGNEQKPGTYWKRVTAYFHNSKEFDSSRNQNALMNRWSVIQLAVNKFCGCYAQVEGLHQSGTTEDDKIEKAQILFKEIYKTAFTFLHCWNILRFEVKWVMLYDAKKQSKKQHRKSNVSTPSTPNPVDLANDSASTPTYVDMERPTGRKAEKARVAKRKADEQQQGEIKTILINMQEDNMKMHNERMKVFRESLIIENERIRQDARRDEALILTMDTSRLDAPTAAWYELRKKDILEQAGLI